MSSSQFRTLLTASLIFGLLGVFFDFFYPSEFLESISQAQSKIDADMSTIKFSFIMIVGLLIAITGIASTIGLFIFKSWAPKLAVSTTVAAISIAPLLGVHAVSGFSYSLSELSTMLWAVALYVIYFTPLKDKFSVKG
ncbi:MAG: hypothetical protein B7Y56_13385 [Gallionellales bacterium 35-53-114]|jgi:urea transporter|nr:MAG: hypothetical protein B7Y56_13385 [Gallionellales bacterium 35-53-114]OYZ63071.1 MAG: hypothetical protein B7Y04_11430 [Gallionellales bacterium 24-53-125]OZB08948.1 MAG: hypothetical protein B7X61_08170 [Gallionellales bacterium 39-52-133]HQS59379.1 hypothetical protein [Gallionellaceae bacterium]HQS76292.1 hypothetical protein [Gallionellaceae bacterium]